MCWSTRGSTSASIDWPRAQRSLVTLEGVARTAERMRSRAAVVVSLGKPRMKRQRSVECGDRGDESPLMKMQIARERVEVRDARMQRDASREDLASLARLPAAHEQQRSHHQHHRQRQLAGDERGTETRPPRPRAGAARAVAQRGIEIHARVANHFLRGAQLCMGGLGHGIILS